MSPWWRRPRGVILLYHRVTSLTFDPQQLAVTPTHFAAHLDVLRRHTRPVPLARLLDDVDAGPDAPPAAAVTFDDGYADNREEAQPLLERYEVPATVFVTAGYIGGRREFWWDDLERLLLTPASLPEILRVRIGSDEHVWHLGGSPARGGQETASRGAWHVECPGDPTPRHRAYRDLCRLLRDVPGRERDDVLASLARQTGAGGDGRDTHRPMTAEAVAALAASPGIEIGAHSVAHTRLAALGEDAQDVEIRDSKARLEEITGRPVTSFAYPFGGRRDYTAVTRRLVRNAGFSRACANAPEAVRGRSNAWTLPRILVRDWDGDAFARRLREWVDA